MKRRDRRLGSQQLHGRDPALLAHDQVGDADHGEQRGHPRLADGDAVPDRAHVKRPIQDHRLDDEEQDEQDAEPQPPADHERKAQRMILARKKGSKGRPTATH